MYIFTNGKPFHHEKILESIALQFPKCWEFSTFGWQPEGFFAFANGIIAGNSFTEVDEDETLFRIGGKLAGETDPQFAGIEVKRADRLAVGLGANAVSRSGSKVLYALQVEDVPVTQVPVD